MPATKKPMEVVLQSAEPARARSVGRVAAAAPTPSPGAAARPGEAPLTLEALFRDHFDEVHRRVARLLGPGAPLADVEDVTQQVFLAAHRALPHFRGESKPSTWLCGIAARTVMTEVRGWRRRRRLVAALEREPSPVADPGDLDEAVARQEELRRVWRCLMKMSAKKRVVYLLHEVEGLEGAQIAEALGIPVATVWTRLHHARRELLRRLGREEGK